MNLPPVAAPPPIAGGAPVTSAAPAPGPRRSFAALVEVHAPAFTSATPELSRTAHPALAPLESVARAQARLDALLAAARAGRTFTAAELIGLQAEAYRCAQTVDLASKLVEQGAQAVKQALNTQL